MKQSYSGFLLQLWRDVGASSYCGIDQLLPLTDSPSLYRVIIIPKISPTTHICKQTHLTPLAMSIPTGVFVLTAELKPLTVMHQDISRHQFLAQMLKAKVSRLLCLSRLVSKIDKDKEW